MDDLANADEPCRQCGLCCRIFGPEIAPTPFNVYTWMEQGRTDILRHFVAFMESGGSVRCVDLPMEDIGGVAWFGLRDPDTGRHVTACPFLVRVAPQRYLCGIHAVRPEMCRNYQPWVWGETFFNRCRALRETGKNALPMDPNG